MKQDLSLSLLSRGRGQFVSSNGDEGRLDVCFTPQDYYSWKSQDALLPLSNSGRLLAETQPVVPKTFSTRKGPLLIYSQYLVTLDASCPQEVKDRKRPVVRQYTQQVKDQLRTFKELTSAFLRRRNKKGLSALAPPSFPPLHLPPVFHHSGAAANDMLQPERFSPELPKRSTPTDGDASCNEWHLPNIAEKFCTVATSPSRSWRDNQSKAERRRFQLPLLLPAREGVNVGKQRGEQTRRQEKMTPEHKGAEREKRRHAEKGQLVPLDEALCPVEVSVSAAGQKGPGKQRSFALLQDRNDRDRRPIKGLLPLELRDPSSGKCVGCLIVGPDGKIIQLSLFANSQDQCDDDGAEERALQVVSAEGEQLPWVVVLQPEDAVAGSGVELNSDVLVADELQKQLKHQLQQFLEPHKLRETSSEASRRADEETDSEHKAKRAEMVAIAPREPGWEDFKDAGRFLDEKGRTVEVKESDDTQLEMNREEEGRSDTRRRRTSSGSTPLREKLQSKGGSSSIQTSANTERAKKVADEKGGMTTKSTAKKPSGNQRDVKTGSGVDVEATPRGRKEEEWHMQQTGSDDKPTKIYSQEERSGKEKAATPPVGQNSEGDRQEITKAAKQSEGGEAAKEEEEELVCSGSSKGRRSQGGQEHQEVLDGCDGEEKVKTDKQQNEVEVSSLKSTPIDCALQGHNKSITPTEANPEHHGAKMSVPSGSPLGSTATTSPGLRGSPASPREDAGAASVVGPNSSHGRLSSCSTVKITEEQLKLNPVKPEPRQTRQQEPEENQELATSQQALQAESQRQDVEKKRREKQEVERKQREERMRSELDEERRKKAESLRQKRQAEDDERRRLDREEQERARREQARREMERRRQGERRRQVQQLGQMREEEELKRRAEQERLRLEEDARQEEERRKLSAMGEDEMREYLLQKEQEEASRRQEEEERKRAEEEAALCAAEEARLQGELLARQMALLEQQLAFRRGVVSESEGLQKSQSISRPWVYSYFTLLQLLGVNPAGAEATTP